MSTKPLQVGSRIGNLTIVARVFGSRQSVTWTVQCDCGSEPFERRSSHMARLRPMCRTCSNRLDFGERARAVDPVTGRRARPVCQACHGLAHRLEPGTRCERCGMQARAEQVTAADCMRSSASRWEGCAA